jgi:hypothetical protein
MAGTPRTNPVFSNPFFLALLVASTLFVVTALGYLVSAYALEAGQARQGEGSRALATWLDHRGPMILAVEFLVMLATGVVAMATDDWFSSRHTPEPRTRPDGGQTSSAGT